MIHVGLLNNMSGAGFEAAERQLCALLQAASEGLDVRVSFYTLPGTEMPTVGYSTVRSSTLDGLIVTGREPHACTLQGESYWKGFTELVDWAERHTYSTIWSCLAAHAAVLHIDGIERCTLSDKLFGVFDCTKVSNHPLAAAWPRRLQIPHSRWNNLPENALNECRYRVITRSEVAGVDAFTKIQRQSMFVFFQGHPEYAADTLLLEYRRDIRRFLRRERDVYPSMPRGCIDRPTAAALKAFQEEAVSERREELLSQFPLAPLRSSVRNNWREPAIGFYRNWLRYLYARKKDERLPSRNGRVAGNVGQREYALAEVSR